MIRVGATVTAMTTHVALEEGGRSKSGGCGQEAEVKETGFQDRRLLDLMGRGVTL